MAKRSMVFTEELYDLKDRTELLEILDANTSIRMVYLEFSHTQLGKDDEWFAWVTRGKTKKSVDKDYRNVWVRGSSTQVLADNIVEILKSCRKEPVHTELYRSLVLRWYITLEEKQAGSFKQRQLVLGTDTSDNAGLDYTTLVLIDAATLEVVMTCRCNQTNLAYVAECITHLLLEHENILFIPERNKNGAVFIDIILGSTEENSAFDPFKRIYNTIVQDLDDDSNAKKFAERNFKDSATRKCFGFTTTSAQASRPLLYGAVLTSMMEYGASRIYDKTLSTELMGLSVKNGRVDHSGEGNDDMVIALLLTGYIVFYGKNLDRYGMDTTKILSAVDSIGTKVDAIVKERQAKYRLELSQLQTKLESCSNEMMKTNYLMKIKNLESVIDDKTYEIKARNIEQPSSIPQRKKQTVTDLVIGKKSAELLKWMM